MNNKKRILEDIDKELRQIHQSDLTFRHKFLRLKKLLEQVAKEKTEGEILQFPSLFSRIVFIAQKYKLPSNLEYNLHQIRVIGNFLVRDENNLATEKQFRIGEQTLRAFIDFSSNEKVDNNQLQNLDFIVNKQQQTYLRVQIIDIQKEEYILICRPKDLDEEVLSVKLNVDKANTIFNETFDNLWIGAQLNIIDYKIDNAGFYIPAMIVLEPDYLIDASAMAECFQNYGNSHLHYFRRRFEPMTNSHYILLGNLANFFLDELIYADNLEMLDFDSVFLKSFSEMPFEFTSCQDIESAPAFRDFMHRAKRQFENIKRVVKNDFKENGFSLDQCVLEPSFYSEKFGFQGRLDLLQLDADDDFTRIVELKSGKTPWPQDDVARIAPNHETQTSVYRLMIQSVFEKTARQIYATILYSSADVKGHNLRLSAPYKQLEKEIVNARNMIVSTEHKLYTGDSETVESIFDELFDLDSYEGRVPDFFQERLAEIKKVLRSCSHLEKEYFYRFVSFVTRELYLQKMGDEGYDSSMSTSALWNTSFRERQDALELISDLEIEKIEETARDMQIRFTRQTSSDFVNFRQGEICIVYPRQTDEDSILSSQILKGTVIEISTNHILVRFRYKQRNKKYFEQNKRWVIEHDKLDHSYNGMYKSLYAFLQSDKRKKDLLLGLIEPQSSFPKTIGSVLNKDEKQKQVIDKALAAKDYFLIVGPPGTGKTSIFARQLIEHFYTRPDTNILVMAYTNRAVDELCSAICSAFGDEEQDCDKYIRIGSEYSCGEASRHRLLQNISSGASRRNELLEKLQNTRIYVGTLASILGKPELFEIKKFDVAIIDEASQILEPQIVGLLPLFEKFIMIGDHKQLSTITLQNELKSIVDSSELNSIGLFDCRESIFERLFRTAQDKKWNGAYETLDYHGRMHSEIADLVNNNFYEGKLLPATKRQTEILDQIEDNNTSSIEKLVNNRRVAFIDIVASKNEIILDKTNKNEATAVVKLAIAVVKRYKKGGKTFDPQTSLGIIAPYRNQIALIKHLLEGTGIPDLQNIMVDTVERYQGSQREVIILSFCFNRSYQMKYFSNLNREETVDRKLNVALTRAREQLFLVGNRELLEQNVLYEKVFEKINILSIDL